MESKEKPTHDWNDNLEKPALSVVIRIGEQMNSVVNTLANP